MIDFVLKALRLKEEVRAGWALRGVRDPESVADHCWGTALLCWLYAPTGGGNGDDAIDRDRAVAMAIVHDIAEAEMGDVATRVHDEERTMSAGEKQRREREAFATVRELLKHRKVDSDSDSKTSGGTTDREDGTAPGARAEPIRPDAATELTDLWEEYERAETATARFVRDMNLCDMCAQAFIYQSTGRYDADAESPAFRNYSNLDEFFETSRPRLSTPVGRELFAGIERRYRDALASSPFQSGEGDNAR